MRVWLDDERKMPEGYTVHVKTAHDAIDLLKTGTVEKISLDHDLGDEYSNTGYDVAKWIEEAAHNGTLKQIRVTCHSQNPVGKQRINAALQNAVKFWRQNGLE